MWVLGGKAHLVYIWFLAGPGRCSMCNFHHQKTHMGPTWGPYVLVLVGSGWEGPSGIHLVFIWATWDPYTCGFFVGRPIWYTSGFQLGEDNVRRAIFTTKTHMGPIWGPYVSVVVGSGWEGPSGIHLVFSWAQPMLDVRFSPPKTHMGPTWGPYAWVLGGKAHLGPIWVLYVSIWAQSIHNYATSPI